jgi:hypothetical protein
MSSSLDFAHRHNDDHTWDSICMSCFLTVATAANEEDLATSENDHDCVDLWVVKKAWILEQLGISKKPSRDLKYYPSERNRTDSGLLDKDNSRHG